MSKITGSFLALVFLIIFSSIIYIWQADAEKRALESEILTQQAQISNLESQLEQQATPSDVINNGDVLGDETRPGTIIGTITGKITLSKIPEAEAILVCALETKTKQESCTDFIIESDKKNYEYSFEIPQGTYEVFAIIPPSETKIYYSEISNCDENGDCTSNEAGKRLIEVISEENQTNIDISL